MNKIYSRSRFTPLKL